LRFSKLTTLFNFLPSCKHIFFQQVLFEVRKEELLIFKEESGRHQVQHPYLLHQLNNIELLVQGLHSSFVKNELLLSSVCQASFTANLGFQAYCQVFKQFYVKGHSVLDVFIDFFKIVHYLIFISQLRDFP